MLVSFLVEEELEVVLVVAAVVDSRQRISSTSRLSSESMSARGERRPVNPWYGRDSSMSIIPLMESWLAPEEGSGFGLCLEGVCCCSCCCCSRFFLDDLDSEGEEYSSEKIDTESWVSDSI